MKFAGQVGSFSACEAIKTNDLDFNKSVYPVSRDTKSDELENIINLNCNGHADCVITSTQTIYRSC